MEYRPLLVARFRDRRYFCGVAAGGAPSSQSQFLGAHISLVDIARDLRCSDQGV